jgi:cytidylate kinase
MTMKMDQKNGGAARKTEPSSSTVPNAAAPFSKQSVPFPELPGKMIIAIDGWAQSGKNTSGELVAEHLGGVLVDSGRFYRALTKGCMESDVDISDANAVVSWCKDISMDIRLVRENGKIEEAQVAINGHWFTKEELKMVGLQTSLVAAIPFVREVVNNALRMCECYGRVVMLGRDIAGVVFPNTPYKFFLDATEEIREQRHFESTNSRGAVKRDIYDASNVIFTENTLMIDTSKLLPAEVSGVILIEVFWRAGETKCR